MQVNQFWKINIFIIFLSLSLYITKEKFINYYLCNLDERNNRKCTWYSTKKDW